MSGQVVEYIQEPFVEVNYLVLKFLALFCAGIFLIQCENHQSNPLEKILVHKKEISDSIIVQKRDLDFPISLFSFLQANRTGLYISSRIQVNENVLFRFQSDENHVEGVVRSGRGPKELEFLTASTKSITGDSLFFFSHATQKFIMIDENGVLHDFDIFNSNFSVMDFSFAVNKDYIAFPIDIRFGRNELITIYNKESRSINTAIEMRVPIGYDPAIRNQVSAICPIPDGFAISFIGDKKIYLIDFNGEVFQEVILGESDSIEPIKKNEQNLTSSTANPYISKMEFKDRSLLILLEGEIIILDYDTMTMSKALSIFDSENLATRPIDFSVNDSIMFVRLGRTGIGKIDLNELIKD